MQRSQPATVVLSAAPGPPAEPVSQRSVRVLGALQVTCGILCSVFHIVAIVYRASMSASGHGMWAGAFYILAGAFGIGAARSRSRCLLVAFLVFSIVAAIMVIPAIVLSSIGLQNDMRFYNYYYSGYYNVRRAMNGLVLALSLMQGIVALFSAVFTCGALCTNVQKEEVHGQLRSASSPGQGTIMLTIPQAQLQQLAQPGINQGVPVTVRIPEPSAGAAAQSPPAYDNAMVHTICTPPPNYQKY